MNGFFIFLSLLSYSSVIYSQSDFDYFVKAKIAEEYKLTDTAILFVSEALKQKNDPLYYEERADLYYKSNNIKAALSDYHAASATGHDRIKYKIASCYSLLDSLAEAAEWLKKYLSGSDKIPENVVKTDSVFKKLKGSKLWDAIWMKNWYSTYESYLGDIYYLSVNNKYNEIFDVLDSAISQYPDKAELWLWRARAFSAGNNPKEAVKSLDFAIKYNPSDVEVLIMRAGILRKNGKSKKAVEDYSAILEIQPWNLKYLKERGFTRMETEDFTGAVTDLLNYFNNDSLDVNVLYQAGKATFLKKDVKGALQLFSKCIVMNNGNSDYFFERGKCYYDLQDNENAFSDFCMAIDLRPNKGDYFYFRGLTYYALKNKTGACHDWEKARSLDFLKAQEYMLRFCSSE